MSNIGSTRREFIGGLLSASALGMAGCLTANKCCGITRPVALQLWSINKMEFWKTPEKLLAEIKALGYDGVEFAGGYGERSAKEVRKLLADAGLRGMGSHTCGEHQFKGDGFKKNLEFCHEAGIESLTNAWADFDTRDGWVKFGELMGQAAASADGSGIAIGMHNHCHEFTKVYDGVTAWDLLTLASDPRLQMQLDTSQVVNPGHDVVTELKKSAGRHFSIHMKENVPSVDGYFGVPPSDGGKLVDWNGIVDFIEAEPTFKWYVVECERRPDSLEPAAFNLKFLRKLGA